MPSNTTNPDRAPRHLLDRLVRQLLDEAKDRKRRVKMRLHEMRGDWVRSPVRGPLLPNGRRSLQWVIYQNAARNHKRATDELAALLRAARVAERKMYKANPDGVWTYGETAEGLAIRLATHDWQM